MFKYAVIVPYTVNPPEGETHFLAETISSETKAQVKRSFDRAKKANRWPDETLFVEFPR